MNVLTRSYLHFSAIAWLCCVFSSPQALAKAEGVAHSGGTNAALARRLTAQELSELVREIKPLIVPVLFYQEQLAKGREYPMTMRTSRLQNNVRFSGKLLRSVQAKLFPENGKDALQELAPLEFKLNENGPCVDLQFNDKDATAFNENPKEICLSAKRLLHKLTTANVMTELLAVVGHELAHRMGADEPEALEFQKMIRHTQLAGSVGEYFWRLGKIGTDYAPIFADPALSSLSAEKMPKSPFAFCTITNRLYMETDSLLQAQHSSLGFSAVRASQLRALEEAGPLLAELSLHCARVSREEVPLGETGQAVDRILQLLKVARGL